MESSAQEIHHHEGDTILKVEKELKKPRFKWLPRLSFLRNKDLNPPP
jgi:hypothetical protein